MLKKASDGSVCGTKSKSAVKKVGVTVAPADLSVEESKGVT
jgi:hypothetical protein